MILICRSVRGFLIAPSESSVVLFKYLVIFGRGLSDFELDSPKSSKASRFRDITSHFGF